MKVLLPLDRSVESEQIIPLMLAEAPQDTEYTLLRVVRPEPTYIYHDTMVIVSGDAALNSEIVKAEIEESLAYLAAVVRRYEGLPRATRCDARIAPTSSKGIVDFAQEEGMDLIAMFVRERTGFAKMFKGRTAKNVARTAKVEVRTYGPADLDASKE